MDAAERIAELEQQVAARDRIIAEQSARIAQLEKQVADLTQMLAKLTEKFDRHSGNSHLPPSSDGPGGRAKDGRQGKGSGASGRKRGGQPGHKGHRRGLLPPEEVDHIINVFPEACANCWQALAEVPDADASRYQVTEVPEIRPETTEFRCHAVACGCGHVTRASSAGVVSSRSEVLVQMSTTAP